MPTPDPLQHLFDAIDKRSYQPPRHQLRPDGKYNIMVGNPASAILYPDQDAPRKIIRLLRGKIQPGDQVEDLATLKFVTAAYLAHPISMTIGADLHGFTVVVSEHNDIRSFGAICANGTTVRFSSDFYTDPYDEVIKKNRVNAARHAIIPSITHFKEQTLKLDARFPCAICSLKFLRDELHADHEEFKFRDIWHVFTTDWGQPELKDGTRLFPAYERKWVGFHDIAAKGLLRLVCGPCNLASERGNGHWTKDHIRRGGTTP